MAIKTKKLRRLFEAAEKDKTPHRFYEDLDAALKSGEVKPSEFSIRDLFEDFVEDGHELVRSWDPKNQGSSSYVMLEAANVNTAAFSNITGQIAYSEVLQNYEQEAFIFSKAIPTVATQFNGEKIPGISMLGDNTEVVGEGQVYPTIGVSEDWIETPQTVKRGAIVPVTKEAIFFDRTGLLLQQCGDLGTAGGLNKEKRAIDCVIDENTTAHRYKWRGTTYASYQATTPWINLTTSNALVDWTDIEAAMLIFANLIDPNTGEPIIMTPKDLICCPGLNWTARRIVNATEVGIVTPGYATSANPNNSKFANPVPSLNIMSSAQLAARQATDTMWFLGDIAKYARYMENFPLAVVQAPSNSEAEFQQDIVARYKVSARGAYVVREPRAIVRSAT